ncbi:MAG: BMP family ABC transporter substrate-binding protein [Oscillospiraceae bacterium]|nr:BMP family ABC transporter substrate-binding protein [Oscillospiraceae bacterium]MBR2889899.1 BMP family ABC transporter substrate-binding protein [Oscillospiraceae bacterium]
MKKYIALLLALVLVMGLAACGEKTPETTAPKGETAGTTPAEKTDLTVALVVADTFGDRSFYDSSKAGCDDLVTNYGITLKTIECNSDGHTQQIYNAADVADVVVLVGWEFFDVEIVAPEYPDVKFVWVDNVTSAPVENVVCIPYAQNEGSFLAGYVAAKMSKTGVIGAVGGEDAATINDFMVGYKQGALFANPEVKVEIQYANTYTDPAVGKECALALHDKGADVIFQVASKTGDGVFQAAQEKGFYAIGVDSDQKYIADDVIICSMVKEVGKSIYQAISEFINGDTSKLGTTWTADMISGYIGLGYGEEGSTQQIPDELKAEVEELKAKITSGEIVVDTTR